MDFQPVSKYVMPWFMEVRFHPPQMDGVLLLAQQQSIGLHAQCAIRACLHLYYLLSCKMKILLIYGGWSMVYAQKNAFEIKQDHKLIKASLMKYRSSDWF